MPIAKKNSEAIKEKDGRRNNGRKPGEVHSMAIAKMTPAQVNKAKKERIRVHSLNALIQEFGSEEEFWLFVANKARSSMAHLDFISKYAFPKPDELSPGGIKDKKGVTIQFIQNNTTPELIEEKTIEAEYEDED